MSEWRDSLISAASALGIELGEAALELFKLYVEEIESGNSRMNLVSYSSGEELAVRHLADSLACVRYLPRTMHRCIDVGSGAGFPGVPVKIVRPDAEMTLVESVGKKAAFLEGVIRRLGLERASVVRERAEILGRDDAHRETYDVAVLRATAPFATAIEYTLPLVKTGGHALIFQGSGFSAGIPAGLEGAMEALGARTAGIEPYDLGPGGAGVIVRIEKTGATSPEYPRKPGVPRKRPLGPGKRKKDKGGEGP
jgi:16S rRNA (guanine527-N7)-methyltransferase